MMLADQSDTRAKTREQGRGYSVAGPVPELPAPARNPLQPFSRNTMSHQQPDAEPKGYEQGYVDGFEAGKAATMEAVAPVQEVVHGSPPLAHQQQPLNTSQGSRPARSTGVTNMTGRGVAASAGPLPSYLSLPEDSLVDARQEDSRTGGSRFGEEAAAVQAEGSGARPVTRISVSSMSVLCKASWPYLETLELTESDSNFGVLGAAELVKGRAFQLINSRPPCDSPLQDNV
ncbi:hypothetical protein WJX82_000795 [Trebouxia sp. C0006]